MAEQNPSSDRSLDGGGGGEDENGCLDRVLSDSGEAEMEMKWAERRLIGLNE